MIRERDLAGFWVRRVVLVGSALVGCALASLPQGAAAQRLPVAPSPGEGPWSTAETAAAVARSEPLVVRVIIALCSNSQIDCGAAWAGQPGRARTNVYWGAIFGARTIFDGPRSGWETVEVAAGEGSVVERAVYRRFVDGASWQRTEPVEQIAVLEAFHGDAIDEAVGELLRTAAAGGTVRFLDGGVERVQRIHAVGYAGHNRLMDGAAIPPVRRTKDAVRSFVLACNSDQWFSNVLRELGSRPIVMTRALMAPEGYVVNAAVKAIGDNEPDSVVRDRVVGAYAKWQRIQVGQASALFAR